MEVGSCYSLGEISEEEGSGRKVETPQSGPTLHETSSWEDRRDRYMLVKVLGKRDWRKN